MESKVRLSTYCLIVTIIVSLVLFIGCAMTFQEKRSFYTIVALTMFVIISALIYAPVSVIADRHTICVKSILKNHIIQLCNVESIELFQPTMGAKSLFAAGHFRLFASGGFMGYWGYFREGDIGQYFAFYGKSSDCFLVTMTNGSKYVIGCQNPQAMVDYIQSNLHTPFQHKHIL